MATKVSDSMLKDGVAIPPGAVMSFAVSAAPVGWLACDGTSKLVSNFQPLFTAIGYTYGGSGSTFNVPNLQGQFVRGLTTNQSTTSRDPLSATRVLGNVQGDGIAQHQHKYLDYVPEGSNSPAPYGGSYYGAAGFSAGGGLWRYNHTRDTLIEDSIPAWSPETRPINISLLYCIKY